MSGMCAKLGSSLNSARLLTAPRESMKERPYTPRLPSSALRMSPSRSLARSFTGPPSWAQRGEEDSEEGERSVGHSRPGSACPFHGSPVSSASRSSRPWLSGAGRPAACSAETPPPSPSPCAPPSSACPPSAPVSSHVQGFITHVYLLVCDMCVVCTLQHTCRGQRMVPGAGSPLPPQVTKLAWRARLPTEPSGCYFLVGLVWFWFS